MAVGTPGLVLIDELRGRRDCGLASVAVTLVPRWMTAFRRSTGRDGCGRAASCRDLWQGPGAGRAFWCGLSGLWTT